MFFKRTKHSKFADLSDEDLIAHYIIAYDQIYLAELFKRYSHLIFLVCMKYLADRDASSDAVMDIYEELLEKLKYHKVNNFKSWIYSVAKNKCLMIIRKDNSRKNKVQIFDIDFMENEIFLNQEDEALFSSELLIEKIAELNKDQKECIERFYFNKQSYKEIAEKISLTEKKVKSCIQNGKRNLKLALLKEANKSELK